MAEKDGIEFIATHGSPSSISIFEQSSGEIKSMYEEKFGHFTTEEVVRRMIVADTAYVNNHPDGLLPLPNGVTINVKDIDHNALATAILAGE